MSVLLPSGYDPLKDSEYMSPHMLEYFKNVLITWKNELLDESNQTIKHLQYSEKQADVLDTAQQESEHNLELRSKDRVLKLIHKIDSALIRIENNEYGFCLETDEEIGVKRLIARPVAEYTVLVQEQIESKRKNLKDNHWSYDNAIT